MFEFLNFVLLIIQFFLFVRAIILFAKNPLDFGALFVLMYCVFYAPAYWDFVWDLGLFSNEYLLYYFNRLPDDNQILKYNFITTSIMVAFEAGYSIKRDIRKEQWVIERGYSRYNYTMITVTFWIILIAVLLKGYRNYNKSIFLFFSPARKNVYTSAYETALVIIIPVMLFTINVLRYKYLYGKVRKRILGFALLMLLCSMTLGQRRELISVLVYGVILFLIVNQKNLGELDHNAKIRNKIILLGAIVAVSIPLLWYMRKFSTQLQRGDTNIGVPWESRGWMELLFGSSSSGVQSTMILDNFRNEYGLPYLHSVWFMLCAYIPRAIFANKPMIISKYVNNKMGFSLSGNVSLFFVNDMYFNFGIFCIGVSFLFGLLLSYFYNKNIKSRDIYKQIFAVITLSQIVLLFKNGFAQYIITLIEYFACFGVVKWLVFPKKSRKKNA